MNLLKLVLFFALSLFFINCSSDKEETATDKEESATPSFTSLYNNVFGTTNCASCHQPGGQAFDTDGVELDFSTQANAYNTLTSKNVTGATSIGTCNGVAIVASAATNSYLAAVLYDDYATSSFGGVASCTPYSARRQDANLSSLASQYKSTLIDWINAGAPNN